MVLQVVQTPGDASHGDKGILSPTGYGHVQTSFVSQVAKSWPLILLVNLV